MLTGLERQAAQMSSMTHIGFKFKYMKDFPEIKVCLSGSYSIKDWLIYDFYDVKWH